MLAADDPAMDNCSGPVLTDRSSLFEALMQYPPMASTQTYSGTGPPCFNAGQELKFFVQSDLGSRVRFDKCYLKVDYVALDVSVPSPYAAIDAAKVSIPWNPIASIIKSCYYQLNGTSQTIERYDATFQHGNMIKMLTSYSRAALEDAHDRFFTPCIESTRDTSTALSAESAARSLRNFIRDAPGTIQNGSKIIMLSDIFDSFTPECAWFVQVFQFYLVLKSPNEILFHTTTAAGIPYFFVTNLRLFIVQDKLSDYQLGQEVKKVKERANMMRLGYRRFDVYTDNHSSTKSYVTTGIKNLQAAVLMFSSVQCGDGVGINPYQYCYNSGPSVDTGISYYRHRYGMTYYPMSGQPVELVDKSRNTEMYSLWRVLCRLINDKTFAPAVPFQPCMGLHGATYDPNNYVFFPAVFGNQDAAPQSMPNGAEHEVVTIGGSSAPGVSGVIVRIRLNAIAISGDTSVSILD